MKYRFTCNAVKWFDKVNGNTYHSVKVVNNLNGKVIVAPFQYGYGEQYRHTALDVMLRAGWFNNIKRKTDSLPCGKVDYTRETVYLFERENKYPILWNVYEGLKRDCIANGTL